MRLKKHKIISAYLLLKCLAFGYDTNDIDMIKLVGTGIAMGNANY